MARETTLVLVKPDGMRRGLAGEIVAPIRAPRARAAGRAPAEDPEGDGARALRRAQGQAVLRLPRRLHLVRPGARARGERRIGDLGRAHDDGRHESARLGAGDDSRRLRARALGEHRPRIGLEGERAARARAVLPRRSCLSRITSLESRALDEDERRVHRTQRGPRVGRARAHVGRLRRSGARCPRARRRRRPRCRRARLRDRVSLGLAREARSTSGGRRRHAGAARDGSRDAARDRSHFPADRGERGGSATS